MKQPNCGIGRIIKITPLIMHVYFKGQEENVAKKFSLYPNLLKIVSSQIGIPRKPSRFVAKNGPYILECKT